MVLGNPVSDTVPSRVALATVMRNSETPSGIGAADFQIVGIPSSLLNINPAAVVVAVCCGWRGKDSDGCYRCAAPSKANAKNFTALEKQGFPITELV